MRLPLPRVKIDVAVEERHVLLRFDERHALRPPVRAGDRDLHAQTAHVRVHLLEILLLRFELELHHVRAAVRAQIRRGLRRGEALRLAPRLIPLLQPGAVRLDHVLALTEEVVFVDDLGKDDRRLVLVAELGVGVVVVPELTAVLFLQLDQVFVEIGLAARRVRHVHRALDAVAQPEPAVGHHVEIGVDAVLLQRVDEIVEPVEALRVERAGVVNACAAGELEDVRRGPVAVHLVEAHEVHPELGQTPRDDLAVLVARETRAAVEVRAPEAGCRAVLELELRSVRGEEPVLPCGHLVLEDETQIDRGVVPRQGIRNGAVVCGVHHPFSFVGPASPEILSEHNLDALRNKNKCRRPQFHAISATFLRSAETGRPVPAAGSKGFTTAKFFTENVNFCGPAFFFAGFSPETGKKIGKTPTTRV